MRRRDVLGFATGAILNSAQGIAHASPEIVRRVALLLPVSESDPEYDQNTQLLKRALLAHGWKEGQNFILTIRSVGSVPSEISKALQEALTPEPDVIVGRSTAVALALRHRSQKTPVVFLQVSDPVGQAIVTSMQKPGDNLTGFTNLEPALGGKWVELLREISPNLQRIAFMGHQESSPISVDLSMSIERTSSALGMQPISIPLRDRSELAPAFDRVASLEKTGLLVAPGAFTLTNRAEITSLAMQRRIPALYPFRYFVTAGGLASYGAEVSDAFRQAADYVDRILKGAKPSDLPVQGPTHLTLIINMSAANSIGVTVSSSLLARADEIID